MRPKVAQSVQCLTNMENIYSEMSRALWKIRVTKVEYLASCLVTYKLYLCGDDSSIYVCVLICHGYIVRVYQPRGAGISYVLLAQTHQKYNIWNVSKQKYQVSQAIEEENILSMRLYISITAHT